MTVPCPLHFESGRTLLLLEGPDKSHTISIWAQALGKWKIPLLSRILTLRALSFPYHGTRVRNEAILYVQAEPAFRRL